MEPVQATILLIIALFAILATGVPVAFGISIVSFGGIALALGPNTAIQVVSTWMTSVMTNYLYLTLPFFILLGEFSIQSGGVREMFQATKAWFGRLPAGLPVTTTMACALFGTVSGSGMAATAVIGRMSYPELMAAGYSKKITAGVIVAAGGLANLIPPSLLAIIYAGLAETSVAAQLMAGLIPGLMLTVGYSAVAIVWCWRWGSSQIRIPEKVTWREKFASLARLVPIVSIALTVFLSIYLGIATATESAGIGAAAALLLCIIRGRLTWPHLREALIATARTTAFLMLIVLSGHLLAFFITYLKIPAMMANAVVGLPLSPIAIMAIILVMYLILGCFLDGVSQLILTLPVLVPVVHELGLSLVWFGVLFMITVEVSVITPPVGLHLYVMRGISNISIGDIVLGATPFFIADIIVMVLILFFPPIALWLT